MQDRAFTLIELLVVVGILSLMVTVGLVSLHAGQRAVRVRGAARDVYAAVRRARSTALVTRQPAVITYSTETVDDEVRAKVEIASAKIFEGSDGPVAEPETLEGEELKEKLELVHIRKSNSAAVNGGSESSNESAGGESVEDILFSPISEDVVTGMKIVVKKDELGYDGERTHKPKVSVFSNVDYLLGRFQKQQNEKQSASGDEKASTVKPVEENFQPVSVVWEANGRTEPHRIWIYPEGSSPEKGLSIAVDSFGGVKVLAGDENE